MKQTFYSNGKLLLTGEYLVLDGAKALALPTRFGQYLDVEPTSGNSITWKSFDCDGSVWYKDDIPISVIKEGQQHKGQPETLTLIKILHEAYKQNPEMLDNAKGFSITTRLTFPRLWGLGTSSTLINNLSQWLDIDAYALLAKSFGGSGYDIACAQYNTPILYMLEESIPNVEPVNFSPDFSDKLFFVYLNKKQNSRSAIAAYRENKNEAAEITRNINTVTKNIIGATDLNSFQLLLERHEAFMSGVLGLPTVKEQLFPDFDGTLKSLGAWGGDFVLAASENDSTNYFKSKGYDTIIPYNDMILK